LQLPARLHRLKSIASIFSLPLFFGKQIWEFLVFLVDWAARIDFVRDTFPCLATRLESFHRIPSAPVLTVLTIGAGFLWLSAVVLWPDIKALIRPGPKLSLGLPTSPVEPTYWEPGHLPVVFVHALPQGTERLTQCRGFIDRIWLGIGETRELTTIRNPLTLKWAFRNWSPQVISPNVELFLDVFHVNANRRRIEFEVPEGIPNSAAHLFDNGGIFQFDLRVEGIDEDGSHHEALLSLGVRSDPNHWNRPEVWPL
jgi:hypothetical protein